MKEVTRYTMTRYFGPPIAEKEPQVVMATDYDLLKAKLDELRIALKSIAANTCCEKCQEAALVAQKALTESEPKSGGDVK